MRIASLARWVLGLGLLSGSMFFAPTSGPWSTPSVLADNDDNNNNNNNKNNQDPTRTPTRAPTSTHPPTNTPRATNTAVPPSPTTPPPDTPTPTPPQPTATLQPPTATPVPLPPPTSEPAPTGGGGSRPRRAPTPTPQPESQPSNPEFEAAAAAQAPAPAGDRAAEGPRFVQGFAALKTVLGETMGEPLEDEHAVDDTCHSQQLTTTGQAYWSCSTAMAIFAADPDGLHHWAIVKGLVLEWFADSAGPPDGTPTYAPGIDPAAAAACTAINDPAAACLLGPGATVPGVILSPGDNRIYRFDQPLARASVHVDLSQLPADYDLFLVDAGGSVLLQSQHEGTAPESVDGMLGLGSYFLYVHSDPGREVNPDAPFQLRLEIMIAPNIDASMP